MAEELLNRLTEDSYYTSTGDHVDVFNHLCRTIEERFLGLLKDTVFCLIKPDAVASGKARTVIEYLGERGFAVARARPVVAAHPRQFELLYAYNLTLNNELNQISDWWLNRQVFEAGPMVSAVLIPSTARVQPAHAKIARLKGSSSPQLSQSGELRRDLAATNKSLNLIHVADDPLSTAREFLIFHDIEALAATLRQVSTGGVSVASGLAEVDLALQAIDAGIHDLDFVRIVARLKLRARMAMTAAGHGDTWSSSCDSCKELRTLLVSHASFEDRLSRLVAIGLEERRAPHWAPGEPDATSRLTRLLATEPFGDEWAREVEAALDASQIFASSWERLVLRSTAHYFADLGCGS